MDRGETVWPKKITVDKNIISVLSQSTYDNFPRALKELITNSYDADAKTVQITIDLQKETVTVFDTGRGMNDSDFDFYLRIAGKSRKKENHTTPLGRNIIGQFGVGFLAVFPFFKNYSIESRKIGANSILSANIPLFKYFSNDNRLIDIGSILINGNVTPSESRSVQSFTKITLSGFNDLTKSFFFPKTKTEFNKNIVETFQGIEKLKWLLSEDLPLRFKDDRFNELFKDEMKTQFEVSVNDEQLLREIYGNDILETHSGSFKQIGNIKLKYCIVTPGSSVRPYKARYLKVRNLNVGIGDDREHFGVEHGATRSRLHWLSGEVHVLEGMNDLVKVSRDGFNYSADYEDMKVFFNNRLNFFSNKLEQAAEVIREVRQTGKSFRVNNVKLLKPDALNQKVNRLQADGFKITTDRKPKLKSTNAGEDSAKGTTSASQFEKEIIIKKKRYKITASEWDYENVSELFPACKVIGSKITVNSNYPLFSGRKYADIFIKMHLMLLFDYNSKKISKSIYKHFQEEILEYYADYL